MKKIKLSLKQQVRNALLGKVRKYLISGLLIWVPILATIWVVKFFVNLLDNSLRLLPGNHNFALFGLPIPGLGVLLCLLILFLTGMLATNFLGQYLVLYWDKLMARIPIIRTIYVGVKQMMETFFQGGDKSFREVLLVEYPCKGTWSIAFQTGQSALVNEVTGEEMVSAFIPTTPNPTSGFLLFFPKNGVKKLNISVDAALKMIISLGVIQPSSTRKLMK